MSSGALATALVVPFEQLRMSDVESVGGKNASLGELWHVLRTRGVRVPPGFAITAEAYRRVLDAAGLRPRLADLMAGLDKEDSATLARRGRAALGRSAIAELAMEVTSPAADAAVRPFLRPGSRSERATWLVCHAGKRCRGGSTSASWWR